MEERSVVEEARRELDRVVKGYTGTPLTEELVAYRDYEDAVASLIAAVRTEHDTPTRCRHCGRACIADECLDCWRQRHP